MGMVQVIAQEGFIGVSSNLYNNPSIAVKESGNSNGLTGVHYLSLDSSQFIGRFSNEEMQIYAQNMLGALMSEVDDPLLAPQFIVPLYADRLRIICKNAEIFNAVHLAVCRNNDGDFMFINTSNSPVQRNRENGEINRHIKFPTIALILKNLEDNNGKFIFADRRKIKTSVAYRVPEMTVALVAGEPNEISLVHDFVTRITDQRNRIGNDLLPENIISVLSNHSNQTEAFLRVLSKNFKDSFFSSPLSGAHTYLPQLPLVLPTTQQIKNLSSKTVQIANSGSSNVLQKSKAVGNGIKRSKNVFDKTGRSGGIILKNIFKFITKPIEYGDAQDLTDHQRKVFKYTLYGYAAALGLGILLNQVSDPNFNGNNKIEKTYANIVTAGDQGLSVRLEPSLSGDLFPSLPKIPKGTIVCASESSTLNDGFNWTKVSKIVLSDDKDPKIKLFNKVFVAKEYLERANRLQNVCEN